MSSFLTVVSVKQAIETVTSIAQKSGSEDSPADQSTGRILYQDIVAPEDIPGFDRSVVDGFAVRWEDTLGSTEPMPALLTFMGKVAMGKPDTLQSVNENECIYIPTGGVLPKGANAVVMIENAEQSGNTILVKRPVSFGENILRYDEDYKQGSLILKSGRRLSARDAGVMAASGIVTVKIAKRPVVAIISTGNELISPELKPGPGQIRDANTAMLASYLTEYGCVPKIYGIIADEYVALKSAISQAILECDTVIISGGSSKDERDMTAKVISDNGELLVHGIAIAPGKPTIIGKINGKPIFGLPGHPASAFVVFLIIVRPLFDSMLGLKESNQKIIPAILAESLPSQRGREEYVRVRLNDGKAIPVFGKSGLLNTLVQSDGLVCVPASCEGLEAGTKVDVILW